VAELKILKIVREGNYGEIKRRGVMARIRAYLRNLKYKGENRSATQGWNRERPGEGERKNRQSSLQANSNQEGPKRDQIKSGKRGERGGGQKLKRQGENALTQRRGKNAV